MTDYIKKEFTKYFNATDVFATLFDKCTRYMFPTVMQPIDEFIRLSDAINNMRQIECKDVAPVRHGRWKKDYLCSTSGGTYSVIRCSECDFQFPMTVTNYCPNCGAIMDKERDEEEE